MASDRAGNSLLGDMDAHAMSWWPFVIAGFILGIPVGAWLTLFYFALQIAFKRRKNGRKIMCGDYQQSLRRTYSGYDDAPRYPNADSSAMDDVVKQTCRGGDW